MVARVGADCFRFRRCMVIGFVVLLCSCGICVDGFCVLASDLDALVSDFRLNCRFVYRSIGYHALLL